MTKTHLKIFTKIPTIKTERRILRMIRVSDAEDCYEYAKDPLVSRYLLWEPHVSIHNTRYCLSFIERKYKRGEFYDWGIEYGGRLVGTVGFTSFDIYNNSGEIGYVLNSKLWRQGIATEAVEAVLDFGFRTLSLERIYARFIKENEASRRLLMRVGLSSEGISRHAVLSKGEYRDVETYAITSEEYFGKME